MKKTKPPIEYKDMNPDDISEIKKREIIGVFVSDYVDVINHLNGHQQISGAFKKGTVLFDTILINKFLEKNAPIEIYEKIDVIHGSTEG